MTGALKLVEGDSVSLSQDTSGKQISISSYPPAPTSAFGELYYNGATCGDILPKDLECFDCAYAPIAELEKNTSTGVTLDGAAGTISLDTAGIYIVHVSAVCATVVEGNIFGSVFQNGGPTHIAFAGEETGGSLQTYHMHGLILAVAGGDVLDVEFALAGIGGTISVFQINFSVHLLLYTALPPPPPPP